MTDLSSGTMTEKTIPDHVYEQYLFGMGLGAYILYNRIPAGADPLGPENILGFCSGFLTGTGSFFFRTMDSRGQVTSDRRLG
ncbi:MAG: aldehyde ferredoxin oxidoreductase N-terminal domain-containing protein [Smithella sp.]|jgi:aldehyde:ferredoxin oxidoreductase